MTLLDLPLHCRKELAKESQEVYEWKPYKTLVADWGAELAADLAKRHRDLDPTLSGKWCKQYLAAYTQL